jgi:hypothetical protein
VCVCAWDSGAGQLMIARLGPIVDKMLLRIRAAQDSDKMRGSDESAQSEPCHDFDLELQIKETEWDSGAGQNMQP